MGRNNNNNNDNGNDRPPRRNRPHRTPLEQRALREAKLYYQPSLNSARRGIQGARNDYQNESLGVESIYGGAGEKLQAIPGQFEQTVAGIPDELQAQLAEYSSMLNGVGMPGSEVAASTGLYGTLGANAFGNLASDRQRQTGYNESAQREAVLSNEFAQQNLLGNLDQQIKDYRNRVMDIHDLIGPMSKSIADQLRDEQYQKQQDQAYSDLMASLIGQQLGGGNYDPGGPGGPGGNQDTGPEPGTQNGQTTPNATSAREGQGYDYWQTMPDWLKEILGFAGQSENYPGKIGFRKDVLHMVPKGGGRRRWLRQNWDEYLQKAFPDQPIDWTPDPTIGWLT